MAADGVDERSPLLSASHSGNVTPTAPPYLQESSPRGKARIELSASHGNVWKEECRGTLAPRRRRASHLGRGRRMLPAAFSGGACVPGSPSAGFATAAAAVESVCLSTSYRGLGSDVHFPSSGLLFPKQPRSVAGRWCRSLVIHNCFGWLKNPGYCSPWLLSLRGLEHQTSLSPTLTPEPSASREVPNQEGQS